MITEIIKAPAGIGKTQLAVAQVAKSSRKPIEIYTPTHALGGEWQENLKKVAPELKVIHIFGRAQPGPDGQTLCRKSELAQALSKSGQAVFPNLCQREQTNNQPPLLCEHYKRCPYVAQFQPADVYIYTHSHLTLSRTTLEAWTPHIAIIDESFYQQCIEQTTLPANLLLSQHIPDLAVDLCKTIYDGIVSGASLRDAITECTINGKLRHAIEALQKLKSGIHPGQSLDQQNAHIKEIVSMSPVVLLLKALRHNRYGQAIQYNQSESIITVHHKKPITRFGEDTRLKIIDASASQTIINAIFERYQYKTIFAKRNAYVTQCYSTRCSTTSLIPERNSDPRSADDAMKRLADINHLIWRKAENGKQVLVIGPQAVVGNPVSCIQPRINIPEHCDIAHFNGFRGVDKWKDFDVVIVIGRNEPSVLDAENMARALYIYDPEPLLLTGKWTTEERGYYVSGAQLGVEVTVHPDARVQAIVEQLREEEILQAIDRLRMMHNLTTKEVIILSNIPLDIDVDELRNWDEIIYGTRLERAMELNGGILPLASDWLAENHPELWATSNAAKMDVKRELAGVKKGQYANSIYIRKMTLFNYKKPSQRSWSWCLSATNDLMEVTSGLQQLVELDVEVKLSKERLMAPLSYSD